MRALELATYRGSTEIVEYLLLKGCKPNNKISARAFDIAVWKCHREIAQLFLKAGIEYKGKNIYHETILFVAACSNNTALTEILIENGCDMNETTRHWTALHAAAARNNDQTLETLIKHGAALDIPDKDGLTALAYCIRNENFKCIKLLAKCGCKIDMNFINKTEFLRNQLIKYPKIEQILTQEITSVKSLKELSRLKVRRLLDQNLISKARHLNVPQTVKDYICMNEFFGTTQLRKVSNNSTDNSNSSSASLKKRDSLKSEENVFKTKFEAHKKKSNKFQFNFMRKNSRKTIKPIKLWFNPT
ncbi:unnamed protein product [Brachionus calyciflorus]|nr:unnamed protein product [Brachionus calyciflorus]